MNTKNPPARWIGTTLMAALLAACSPAGNPDQAASPLSGAGRAAVAPQPEAATAPPAHVKRPVPAATGQRDQALRAYSMQASPGIAMEAPAGYYPPPRLENREHYAAYRDNPVIAAQEQAVSTFGVDVDTGSYTNVRRLLNEGRLPPADAVRAEEFINYFDYDYPAPQTPDQPFRITTELAAAPWNTHRQLLKIGIQGYRVDPQDIPAANLVFLVDTSGSMADRDKLPLLQAALKQLVAELRPQDRVAIVTYAGQASMSLDSTPGDQKARINAAIDGLRAAGSTNGGAGLDLAYAQAAKGFVKGGVNRILLASDGDFNVGATDLDVLKKRIARHRQDGVALTTLGVGGGNFNDALAVQLADAGNGSYHYLDSLREARKVLAGELSSTLLTIAQDVKVQVEFNPAVVAEYRLIGYEKRALAREDFHNDRVDAGEIGAGANVTALYEITPVGAPGQRLDPLRYGKPAAHTGRDGELAFVRVRYKMPGATDSRLVQQAVARADAPSRGTDGMRRAAAAAAFAQWLRGGKYLDGYTPAQIASLAREARGADPLGLGTELAGLAELAASLGTPAVP